MEVIEACHINLEGRYGRLGNSGTGMVETEKRLAMEHIVQWARRAGQSWGDIDNMPDEQRREVLRLLLDGKAIDGDNNVKGSGRT